MFLFLSKFLPLFVYPLGLVCILTIFALLFTRQDGRDNKRQRVFLLLILVVLLLGGNRWIANGLARSLEWRYLPPAEVPQAGVIVVLGGGTMPAEAPRTMVEVNGAGDRVLYAAWLYKQGKAPNILLSGGTLDWVESLGTPARQMAEILEMMAIPSEALWLEERSRNTYENALYSAEILHQEGIQQILLVTSASHMPRSVGVFEAQGFDVVPLPTDFVVTKSPQEMTGKINLETVLLGLVPSVDNMALTTRMLKEYIGIFVYKMRGWL